MHVKRSPRALAGLREGAQRERKGRGESERRGGEKEKGNGGESSNPIAKS